MTRPRAVARMLRAANLPSVFSNCLTGAAIGEATVAGTAYPLAASVEPEGVVIGEGLLIGLGVMTFYLAGAILNDVFDVKWDREHRPDRPLAAGLVSTSFATWTSAVLIVVGIGWAWTMGTAAFAAALALLGVVLAYDALHKRFAGAVLFMGLARGMVIVTAALSVNGDASAMLLVPVATVVAVYTTLLTFVARGEYRGGLDARRWLAVIMPLVVLSAAGFVLPGQSHAAALVISGALVAGWLAVAARHVLAMPARTGRAVGLWLVGLCFIDAWCCALLGAPIAAIVAAALGLVMFGLQRLAPGT